MIKTIGSKFRRALHFDFHTSPGIENILQNFDAEHFAEQMANAHIEYVNVAARCNMGYSYYNTQVGKKYPGLGDRDMLDELEDIYDEKRLRNLAVILNGTYSSQGRYSYKYGYRYSYGYGYGYGYGYNYHYHNESKKSKRS